jgi:hypothetical protein
MIKPGLDWSITAESVGQPLKLSYSVSRQSSFALGGHMYGSLIS